MKSLDSPNEPPPKKRFLGNIWYGGASGSKDSHTRFKGRHSTQYSPEVQQAQSGHIQETMNGYIYHPVFNSNFIESWRQLTTNNTNSYHLELLQNPPDYFPQKPRSSSQGSSPKRSDRRNFKQIRVFQPNVRRCKEGRRILSSNKSETVKLLHVDLTLQDEETRR